MLKHLSAIFTAFFTLAVIACSSPHKAINNSSCQVGNECPAGYSCRTKPGAGSECRGIPPLFIRDSQPIKVLQTSDNQNNKEINCKVAYIDNRKLSQSIEIKSQLESLGFSILTGPEVYYVKNEYDLTNFIFPDGFISDNTKKQLEKINRSKCNLAFISAEKIMKDYSPAKATRKKLEAEFTGRDKSLVEMKNKVTQQVWNEEYQRFSNAFNIRRDEELGKLLLILSEEIKRFSIEKKLAFVVTEKTNNYKSVEQQYFFSDETDSFKKFSDSLNHTAPNSLPSQNTTPPDIERSLYNSSSIEDAKDTCSELGLKKGTEKFGNCVLKLTK